MKIESRKYQLKTYSKKLLADTLTPVSVYLRLRDKFPHSLLLESSDYRANNNSFSYICFNPIASIKGQDEIITQTFPDGLSKIINLNHLNEDEDEDEDEDENNSKKNIPNILDEFAASFSTNPINPSPLRGDRGGINGLFGYMAFDAVRYFEDINISKKEDNLEIPDLYYAVYQNIIAINHINNEAFIFAHCYKTENNIPQI